MTSVSSLSEFIRSCFSFWALIDLLICIFSAALAVTQKRYRFAFLALFPFIGCYLMWQVLFDIHMFGVSAKASHISRAFGGLAWFTAPLSLIVLTAAALLILILLIRYGKRSVTPTAVKHCLDQMPCGVCCWGENGIVLFSNVCMNRLCVAVTGGPLLDGNGFCNAVNGRITEAGKKVWRFSHREIVSGGETLHEMIASDITSEYAKTLALEKDKAELSRLNRELKEYTLGIDDAVRRREILQAKVNIHDEMNRLMLSTVAAKSDDTAELDRIFSLWEQNALLLCMESGSSAGVKASERIEKLASALGIDLIWQGEPPAVLAEKQRDLFYSAAQEAIANAAKHARAKTMCISIRGSNDCVVCRFTNDGAFQQGNVRFTGGLANLSILARKRNAYIETETGEKFTLTLKFMPCGG